MKMDWDFLRVDHLLPASNEKHRSFSTSTPFIHGPEHKLRSLSVSVSSSTQNDSGLGASLSEATVSSFVDSTLSTETCPYITVSLCQTPTKCGNFTSFSPRQLELCVSPVSSKSFSFRQLESDFNSRKSFLARRSLDSDFSSDNSPVSSNNTLSTEECREQRTFDTSFARKLDLDLDIYDRNNDLCSGSVSSLLPHKEAQFDEILQKFSPSESDRLIGRKMGRDQVDILSELSSRNIRCVSTIMSFLEPQDLCRMCNVSSQWKTVCETDKLANQRRKRFLRHQRDTHRKMGKENAGKRSVTPQTRTSAVPLQNLPVLQLHLDMPSRNDARTTTEQFIAAASGLRNDEKLQKCPKCRKPAKVLPVQDRGKCQNHDCNYDYCIKCLCEFHGSKDCAPIASKKTKTDAIGTRKSKRNLKRL